MQPNTRSKQHYVKIIVSNACDMVDIKIYQPIRVGFAVMAGFVALLNARQ